MAQPAHWQPRRFSELTYSEGFSSRRYVNLGWFAYTVQVLGIQAIVIEATENDGLYLPRVPALGMRPTPGDSCSPHLRTRRSATMPGTQNRDVPVAIAIASRGKARPPTPVLNVL